MLSLKEPKKFLSFSLGALNNFEAEENHDWKLFHILIFLSSNNPAIGQSCIHNVSDNVDKDRTVYWNKLASINIKCNCIWNVLTNFNLNLNHEIIRIGFWILATSGWLRMMGYIVLLWHQIPYLTISIKLKLICYSVVAERLSNL